MTQTLYEEEMWDCAKAIRKKLNIVPQDNYPTSLLIVYEAAGLSHYRESHNWEAAKALGLGQFCPSRNVCRLANNIIKYHDRFGNLPSDKLAKEWLDEVLND